MPYQITHEQVHHNTKKARYTAHTQTYTDSQYKHRQKAITPQTNLIGAKSHIYIEREAPTRQTNAHIQIILDPNMYYIKKIDFTMPLDIHTHSNTYKDI